MLEIHSARSSAAPGESHQARPTLPRAARPLRQRAGRGRFAAGGCEAATGGAIATAALAANGFTISLGTTLHGDSAAPRANGSPASDQDPGGEPQAGSVEAGEIALALGADGGLGAGDAARGGLAKAPA